MFLYDGQGTVKRAILFTDRPYWNMSVKREYLLVNTVKLHGSNTFGTMNISWRQG